MEEERQPQLVTSNIEHIFSAVSFAVYVYDVGIK
jgi:hypothetical protein